MTRNQRFLKQAGNYEKKMVRFLRDMIAIPSESAEEKRVIARIRKEMKETGAFDRIWTDKMGNLFGQVGNPGKGKKLLAIDAHVDTVGVGDLSEWKHDPYKGKVADGKVWGRGAGDQEGAVPAMVYAARIMRDLDVDLSEFALLMTFTVMEEDCDGLCWQYIVNEGKIRPDAVVVTDSTNCTILRGHRGRMEIGVTCKGKSCHGSMPEKGDNAVYKIAKIVGEIEKLNTRLKTDKFLGKGTITVSYVDCKTPSLCAVPGQAYIHLDRRLTNGDTRASAVAEVKDAIKQAGVKAKVEVLRYARPSYTGLTYETEKYFPTWCEPEDALQVQAAIKTYRDVLGKTPTLHRWTFSTNAVSIAGMFGIPCVGFGPAPESVAHTVNDSVPIEHMVRCGILRRVRQRLLRFGGEPGKQDADVRQTEVNDRLCEKMMNNLKGKHYIETQELSLDELELLLSTASELKEKFRRGEPTRLLPNQTAFLLFFDKSTRTRNAFEAGMTQLGGHAHFLDADVTQISHGETPADTGRILASMGHGICIRHDLVLNEGNRYMRDMAAAIDVPVINMQCDVDHPTQTLADLMTIREIFGNDLAGKKIAVSWAYAPSYAKPLSVPQGLITLMTRFGMHVSLVHPPGYNLIDRTVESARTNAAQSGGSFEIVENMDAAFEGADIVYPKSWGMYDLMLARQGLHKQDEIDDNQRACLTMNDKFKDWICDQRRMKLAGDKAIYMHCLPADRGSEVTDAVIDGSQSVVFQEAENRLHTAKAIMACTMRERPFQETHA